MLGKIYENQQLSTQLKNTIFGIKFESVYHLCQLAHPLLKASGAGRIVFLCPLLLEWCHLKTCLFMEQLKVCKDTI